MKNSVSITLADISVAFAGADAELCHRIETQYHDYLGHNDSPYHIQTFLHNEPKIAAHPKTVEVSMSGTSLSLHGRQYRLALDLHTKSGELHYSVNQSALHEKRTPPSFHAAIKALYAVLLLQEGKGFFIHSSAVALAQEAICFLGLSGAGKSTICAMFDKQHVYNDELNILLPKSDGVLLTGTPFSGDYDVRGIQKTSTLRGGFFIQQSRYCKTNKITFEKALSGLWRCIVLPQGAPCLEARAFELAQNTITQTSWQQLEFTKKNHDVLSLLNNFEIKECA